MRANTTAAICRFMLLALWLGPAVFAAARPPASQPPAGHHEIALQFSAGPLGLSQQVNTSFKDVPFRKSPNWQGHRTYLGTFGPENRGAFGWDATAGQLYLDLNGNLDLTDDPSGVLPVANGGIFTHRFSITSGTVTRAYNARFQFRDPHSRILAIADFHEPAILEVQSGWKGAAELEGTKWDFAVIDTDLDGTIGSHDALAIALAANGGFRDLDVIRPHKQLCLQSRLYNLSFRFDPGKPDAKLTMLLDEVSTDTLRPVSLTGRMIRKLQIEEPGDDVVGVYERPAEVVLIPSKRSLKATVYVSEEAPNAPVYVSDVIPITAKADQIGAGAPLRNIVAAIRKSSTFEFTYALKGRDDTLFRSEKTNSPPTIKIEKKGTGAEAGKQVTVVSAKLSYG